MWSWVRSPPRSPLRRKGLRSLRSDPYFPESWIGKHIGSKEQNVSPDLVSLARVIADWVEPVLGVPAVYLFGSRVRGDHRPDSAVARSNTPMRQNRS
jgi:hypothetical protein